MIGFGKVQPKVLGIAIAAFVAGASIFASPVPQAIAAIIATDVACSQCVGTNSDGTNDIKDGSVASRQLANSAFVTNTRIVNNAVTGAKIADGTIVAADLASNAVTGAKISDATITAADLAADSVAASEITGVSKLLFAPCTVPAKSMAAGSTYQTTCAVSGADADDFVQAQNNHGNPCIVVMSVIPATNSALLVLKNDCAGTISLAQSQFGLIIWDN